MSDQQSDNTIRLDQFMKLHGLCDTGGQAKWMIQSGVVKVNRVVETRRRRQLRRGDVVSTGEITLEVQ